MRRSLAHQRMPQTWEHSPPRSVEFRLEEDDPKDYDIAHEYDTSWGPYRPKRGARSPAGQAVGVRLVAKNLRKGQKITARHLCLHLPSEEKNREPYCTRLQC